MSIPVLSHDMGQRWMSVDDGAFLWALPLGEVVAVRALGQLEVLPQSIPGLLGLMTHLGELLPVVDLSQLMGRPVSSPGQVVVLFRLGAGVIGLRCQNAGQMVSGTPTSAPENLRPGWGPERIPGIRCLRTEDKVWWLVEPRIFERRLGTAALIPTSTTTRLLRLEVGGIHLAVDLSMVVRAQLLDVVLLEPLATPLGGVITARYREEGGWWPVWSLRGVLNFPEESGGVLVTLTTGGRPFLLRADKAWGLFTPRGEDCFQLPATWSGKTEPLCDEVIRGPHTLWRLAPGFFTRRVPWALWEAAQIEAQPPAGGR